MDIVRVKSRGKLSGRNYRQKPLNVSFFSYLLANRAIGLFLLMYISIQLYLIRKKALVFFDIVSNYTFMRRGLHKDWHTPINSLTRLAFNRLYIHRTLPRVNYKQLCNRPDTDKHNILPKKFRSSTVNTAWTVAVLYTRELSVIYFQTMDLVPKTTVLLNFVWI